MSDHYLPPAEAVRNQIAPAAAILEKYSGLDPDFVDLDPEETGQILGVALKTLEGWRRSGNGPSFLKIGRCPKYPLSAVLEFRKQRIFKRTSEHMRLRRNGGAA